MLQKDIFAPVADDTHTGLIVNSQSFKHNITRIFNKHRRSEMRRMTDIKLNSRPNINSVIKGNYDMMAVDVLTVPNVMDTNRFFAGFGIFGGIRRKSGG